jgi:intermembrane space import and assembly protein 40
MTLADLFNRTEAISRLDQSLHQLQESKLPTLDSIVEEKRQRLAQQQQQAIPAVPEALDSQDDQETASGIEDLEDEADQEGAFNPETGEINWDCPCLGGMAHGPCGEEFKAAYIRKKNPREWSASTNSSKTRHLVHVVEPIADMK